MSFEGFDDWDEIFLDQAIRIEEGLIAISSANPTQHHQSTVVDLSSFSPPREFSQRFTDKDLQQPEISNATRVSTLSPSINRRAAKEKEIDKLKRELGRVSKQLSHLEQEYVELQKDKDKKEEQLNYVFSQIRTKDAEIHHLKRTNVEYGAIVQDLPRIPHQCQKANMSIDWAGPQIDSALTTCKAVGVQTDTFDYSSHHAAKNDLSSQHDLSNKLISIWGSPRGHKSGKNLVSKLIITCASDFHVLFRCMSMDISSKITQDSLAHESFSDVALHDHMQSAQSVEAAKISRLYFMVTKMSNEMVRLDSLFEALLDLCITENVVIVHRCLCIVHVILQHMLRLNWRSDRRDNVTVEGISSKNFMDLHKSERVQTVQLGVTKNDMSFSEYASSSMRSFDVGGLCKKEHENPGNITFLSCLDWVSLFEMMHRIAIGNKQVCIQVESLSIMNLILMRSNPFLEREKFGLAQLFESVSRLLRKQVNLCVRKQALRLLFLLLNCPKLLIMFCSGCKDDWSTGDAADGTKDAAAFQGFSNILESLAECLACNGTGTLELKLRRHAIIMLAFVASSGKSGFEVLLGPGMSRRINFLELIMRVLASEMDVEAAGSVGPPDTCRERTLLIREALILLNRLASNPVYSAAVLGALTSSRDMASLTIDVANKMSRKGSGCHKSDSMKKAQMKEAEIVDLARVFKTRVFTYLGESIS